MAQNRIALAFADKDRTTDPVVVYCGGDADACNQAINAALASGQYARAERYQLNTPVVKYADGPAPAPVVADAAPADEPKRGRKSAK